MTQLSPQDHHNRLERRYQAWRNAARKGKIVVRLGLVILLGGLAVLGSASILTRIPSEITTASFIVLFTFGYASIIGGIRVETRERRRLPQIEDHIFYLLHSVNEDLRSFGRTGLASDKEHAVSLLTECAAVIDSWTWGNLKFLRDSVGKSIVEFKLNFRGRLLVAVQRTSSESSFTVLPTLMEIEDVFEQNRLNQSDLDEWNKWLIQRDPADPSKEKFPYTAPPARQGKFSGLKSRKHQLTFLFFGLIGPALTYLLVVELSLASHDAAVYSSVAVLGIVATAYFAYLPLTKSKGRSGPDQ